MSDEARRPAFARDFPREPRLDALVAAFEAGDFARVRSDAPALAADANDPAVKRAAELLRARIEPDPLARALLVITGALLIALSAWWIAHDAPPPRASPPPPPSQIERVN